MSNKRKLFINFGIPLVLFVALTAAACFLPRSHNVTTIYFNTIPVTLTDIRNACRGATPGIIIQITPTITVNCAR